MNIMMRPSYFAALAELAESDQKQAKKFLDKLDQDRTTKGLHIEKIKNSGFVSIKASKEIRVIGQWIGEDLMLHHIDHHDDAYAWADKHKRLSELMSGGYQFIAGDISEEKVQIEVKAVSLHDASSYGKSILDKLVGLGFPINVARTLETVQSEDDLLERIEELPRNTLYMVLDAIFNDIPYNTYLSNTQNGMGEVVPLLEALTVQPLETVAKLHKEARPTATAIEAPTTTDTDTSRQLQLQQTPSQHTPIDVPLTYVSDKVEAELKRLESIVSSTTRSPIPIVADAAFAITTSIIALPFNAGTLRIECIKDTKTKWWLLRIYDGDTFIGSYERSGTEEDAKEKEIEIPCAAAELRAAFLANGNQPFVVRYNGASGTKQIKSDDSKTAIILGTIPKKCFRTVLRK